jgi:hypothetical protein
VQALKGRDLLATARRSRPYRARPCRRRACNRRTEREDSRSKRAGVRPLGAALAGPRLASADRSPHACGLIDGSPQATGRGRAPTQRERWQDHRTPRHCPHASGGVTTGVGRGLYGWLRRGSERRAGARARTTQKRQHGRLKNRHKVQSTQTMCNLSGHSCVY